MKTNKQLIHRLHKQLTSKNNKLYNLKMFEQDCIYAKDEVKQRGIIRARENLTKQINALMHRIRSLEITQV